jgi:hypothetical protein
MGFSGFSWSETTRDAALKSTLGYTQDESQHMATYASAVRKFLEHPIDLNPDDIRALKAHDPWLARAAVKTWEAAMRWDAYRRKYPAPEPKRPLPVVRLNRSLPVVKLNRPKR